MEFFRTIRDKHQSYRQEQIERDARHIITLTDFSGKVFIACNGLPIISVSDAWTSREIVQKLEEVRENYISAKMEENFKKVVTGK